VTIFKIIKNVGQALTLNSFLARIKVPDKYKGELISSMEMMMMEARMSHCTKSKRKKINPKKPKPN
jgi:hypothetical protein